eukprot:COSAG01_NODE_203_length_22128_cov_280.658359_9_plen_90_part_00
MDNIAHPMEHNTKRSSLFLTLASLLATSFGFAIRIAWAASKVGAFLRLFRDWILPHGACAAMDCGARCSREPAVAARGVDNVHTSVTTV